MKAGDLIKKLEASGWTLVRQKGSHKTFKHDLFPELITIPDHGKDDLKPGLLNNILKLARLK